MKVERARLAGWDVPPWLGTLPAVELAKAKMPGLAKLYVDGVYTGAPIAEIRDCHQLDVEIVRRPKRSGGWYNGQLPLFESTPTAFVVLRKRWINDRPTKGGQQLRGASRRLPPF